MKNKPSTDSTMLVMIALIRALHKAGVIPAQAVAEELGNRALNVMLRGVESEREDVVQNTAAMLQKLADDLALKHPFVHRTLPGIPPQT